MPSVCPECGYNAGENGEKILELHMRAQHSGPGRLVDPELLARWRLEEERLTSMTILILGTISVLAGLAVAAYGANNFAFLTCRLTSLGSCFYPQYLGDQIRTSGFQAVYVGSQEAAYGGLLLASMGSMVVAFWRTRTMQLSQRVTLVLLVGIFLIVLSTALAIAMGYIPFGQRANYLG